MSIDKALQDFINDPDTVDFVTRKSDYFLNYVKDNPNIVLTQTLYGNFIVGYISAANYDYILKTLGSGYISSVSSILGTLDRENLEKAGIIQVQNQPYLDLQGNGVLIGIVDTGIDYTKDIFIYEDGTSKIQYIYDQSVIGNPPEGFFIGEEYSNEQINQALKSENPYDIVPQRDTSGHGTFLASVAAGRKSGEFIGAAPESELIVVKLKKARKFYLERFAVPEDQENAFESSAVIIGIEYILAKAKALNRPVAICLGLGTNMASHDGLSIFEQYLSTISNLRGVCLCTAAGNESEARHHTTGKLLMKGDTQNIDIKVGGISGGDIFLSIWNNVSDRFSVSVRSPTGELVSRVPAKSGTIITTKLILEKASVTVEYFFPIEGSGSQLSVVIIRDATPGIWTITVYGDIVLDGTYHAWLPMTGFVSPYIEFMSASPYYTITVPGTMFGAICCGAYNTENNSLYTKSSWGPTRTPMMAPDLVAPGVNIGGFYPTGYGTMSGTSVATAITTGACALLLQWGIVNGNEIAMSTYQIRAYLIRGCNRSETISYPNTQWGYGSLNLIQTFQFMREI